MNRFRHKGFLLGVILFAWWVNLSCGFMGLPLPTADRGAFYSDGLAGYPLYHAYIIGRNGTCEGRGMIVCSLPGLDSGISLAGAEIQLHVNLSASQDPPEPLEFHENGGTITNTSDLYIRRMKYAQNA